MIEVADADGDGQINYDEYRAILTRSLEACSGVITPCR